MPSIRDVVQALGKREGVDAVLLLGRDGLPIDSVGGEALQGESVAALVPSVVLSCHNLGLAAQRGAFKTTVVECESGYMIVNALGADALLALIVQPNTNLGSLLYELRRYQTAIAGLL